MKHRASWIRMAVSGPAWLALAGLLGCAAPPSDMATPDDTRDAAVWVALQRGDVPQAEALARELLDPGLAARAQLDLLAASGGRGAACVAALETGSWLAARYLASDEAALARLREERRRGPPRGSVLIEEARRSDGAGRALSALREARRLQPGAPEARASEIELLLALGRLEEAEELLAHGTPDGRLCLARARLLAATGRGRAAAQSLIEDLRAGLAVPASLVLLHELLAAEPDADLEARAWAALQDDPGGGWRQARARLRLLAWLASERGDMDGAIAALRALEPRAPEDDAALQRLLARAGGPAPAAPPLEPQLDADPDRPRSVALGTRRLTDEWDLAARAAWRDVDEGRGAGLDDFLARLDAAAAGLPGAPSLAALPRREFGIFGTLLDTTPLEAELPDLLVVGGQALTLPADLAVFDAHARRPGSLPEDLQGYVEVHVRRPRVAGYLASRGAQLSGAALDPVVWIDLDQLEREERGAALWPQGPPCAPLPARGRAERLALDEPLDVARWLEAPSRTASDGRHAERLAQALSAHERQHVRDFRAFTRAGAGGKLALLWRGGLLPGAVRAEVERRAQLAALREAEDPRLALAHAVSSLPVEGAARAEPHAAGYARLVEEFLARLDAGDWPGARPLPELGLDPQAVLLQQLHRLDPQVVRAIALAMDD